ncbi:hypothetical protein QFC19_002599 [Naganishia cerealis]|uniref:Uncharacterized protein n=1 Tax=Naganishia cerealis TaxID=610337 RepID=A0ACC2WAP3_9TREE|nr:hypothetical protein QFC19_002599 [Naganishia cerealis]
MTSLNPSHLPSSSDNPRRGQAIYKRETPEDSNEQYDEAGYPKSIKKLDRDARKEARQRIKRVQPPIPDLRFEQSYLLSIRPFLHAKSDKGNAAKGQKSEASNVSGGPESMSLTTSADQDAVFSWGKELEVDYRNLLWVTFKDQLVSPLVQGFFWGVLTVTISTFSQVGRTALYPASHKSQGRISGGEGGELRKAGAGEAVGQTEEEGWWRKWVKSWAGGLESLPQSAFYLLSLRWTVGHQGPLTQNAQMPPLRTKTNLPNAKIDSTPSDGTLKQKHTKSGAKTSIANRADKYTSAATTRGKEDIGKVQARASRKEVQVGILVGTMDHEIDELLNDEIDELMEDEDELVLEYDDAKHIGERPDGASHLGGDKREPPKEDQDTLDSLLDSLLESQKGKGTTAAKHIIGKLLISCEEEEAAYGPNKGTSSIEALNKRGKNESTPIVGGGTTTVQQTFNDPTLATRPLDGFTSVNHLDLAHTVVIKVIEHALKKNIDWFNMAKELEQAGLTNDRNKKVAKTKGKAKGKKGQDEKPEDNDVTVKAAKLPKFDGNYLCK